MSSRIFLFILSLIGGRVRKVERNPTLFGGTLANFLHCVLSVVVQIAMVTSLDFPQLLGDLSILRFARFLLSFSFLLPIQETLQVF